MSGLLFIFILWLCLPDRQDTLAVLRQHWVYYTVLICLSLLMDLLVIIGICINLKP